MTPRWIEGSEAVRARVDASYEAIAPAPHVLSEGPRRRVLALPGDAGEPLALKEYRRPDGRAWRRRPARTALQWLRALTGNAASAREWRALRRLEAAGIDVPSPLARALLPGLGSLLVCRLVEGPSLQQALASASARERRTLMGRVGELVARLHRAGFVHRDLHVGNILVAAEGPVLIDLQRARESRERTAWLRDIADLDFSLQHEGLSIADRLRFRRAALSLTQMRSSAAREALREVGRAAVARALVHYAGRTRRCLQPGPERQPVSLDGRTGLRASGFGEQAVRDALDAHERDVREQGAGLLKCDHRSRVSGVEAQGRRVVVKEVVKGSPRRWLADAFRGSPARRAWIAAHGLAARHIDTPAPLAFLEQRRFAIPVASWLIVEDLRPARAISPDPPQPRCTLDPEPLARVLRRLLERMHRTHVDHGDLQALHVFVIEGSDAPHAALIDLEGVRFPRHLSDDRRIQAIAELNASIEDDRLPAHDRCTAFAHYARHVPFQMDTRDALRAVVLRSLERQQHWRGGDCSEARSIRGKAESEIVPASSSASR